MLNVFTRFLALLPAVLILAACGTPAPSVAPAAVITPGNGGGKATAGGKLDWQQNWDAAVAAAQKEGEILVYFPPSPATDRPLAEAFNRKYGIKVNYVMGRGQDFSERVFAERRAGIFLGDLIIQGNSVHLSVFKPEGVLQPLDSYLILPEVTDPKVWIGGGVPFLDKDHMTIAYLAGFVHYVVRNTDLVKPGELKSYMDLLQPPWKGQMVVSDPSITGTGQTWFTFMLKVLGEEKGLDYMRQLVKQDPMVTRDARLMIETVAKGKYKLAVAALPQSVTDWRAQGAPLEHIRMAEGGMISSGAGIVSMLTRPAHPNAGIVFLNWLLTKEAQTIFSQGFKSPSARTDVSTEGMDPISIPLPGEKIYMNDEEFALASTRTLPVAKEIFGPLLK